MRAHYRAAMAMALIALSAIAYSVAQENPAAQPPPGRRESRQ